MAKQQNRQTDRDLHIHLVGVYAGHGLWYRLLFSIIVVLPLKKCGCLAAGVMYLL